MEAEPIDAPGESPATSRLANRKRKGPAKPGLFKFVVGSDLT
jgi:hypothetical protein